MRRTLPLVGLFLALASGGALAEEGAYDRALSEYQAGHYAAAVEILEGVPERDSGLDNLLGWALLREGRKTDAVGAFEDSVEKRPEAWDSWCGLGFAHLQLENLESAAASFEVGVQGPSPALACRLAYGRVLEGFGENERALVTYRRVLELDPGNETAAARVAVLEAPPPEDPVRYFARGSHFWAQVGDDHPEVLYVEGVNLSFALPGRYTTEFPADPEFYLDWFDRIREMNANVVRVYTILPPVFYEALARFNRGRPFAERLLLVQGIWATLPEHHDFRDPSYVEAVRSEIRDAVDVVHGNAVIPHRYGHAHGIYRADVSNYLLAFIFGREWEPGAVATFDQTDGAGIFEGSFIGIRGGTSTEVWLTEMLDHLVGHEIAAYEEQRPVAWMNWPPLDPLHHPAEATYNESLVFRKQAGEDTGEPLPVSKIFDDDAVSLDETKLIAAPVFRAGVFVSHHVYPYYPDFLRNEPAYVDDPAGPYLAYLRHLKSHYRDIPLLVSEYGVPTSRGIARSHPEGLSHGGLSEERQAEALAKLTREIREADCAGGIVFAWIDEWLKRTWMVAGTEERDPHWYNAEDPEESYGILAVLPTEHDRLGAGAEAWSASTLLYESEAERPLESLRIDSDAGYLYLRLEIGSAPDWSETAYLLALDTYGDDEGDHVLPFDVGLRSPVGFEFIVLIHGDRTRLLVDDRYNRTRFDEGRVSQPGLSGYELVDDYLLEPNENGTFTEIVIPHVRKFGRDGTVYPEDTYHASRLRHGKSAEDSLADWYLDDDAVEVRIPWGMLHVADPSRRRVLLTSGETVETDGIRVLAVAYEPGSAAVKATLPEDPAALETYAWPVWESPEYVTHLKPAYDTLQETFASLEVTTPTLHLAPGFDYASVVEAELGSMEAFLEQEGLGVAGDPYGQALADLALGLATDNTLLVLGAEIRLRKIAEEASDSRVRDFARRGSEYARSLLDDGVEPGIRETSEPERVEVKKHDPPRGPFKRIVIGESAIRVREGDVVRTQVDRVTRDWLLARNFASAPWSLEPETIVRWHEGEKVRELLELVDLTVEPVWGTPARRFGNTWYAPDGDGVFRFPVTLDKVYNYPSNVVLDENNVLIHDTHGISALAWDSTEADLVLGCGDHPGKAEAAYWLATKGVDVYTPTDRFLGELIGAKTDGVIVGSAPVRADENGAVIGNQPIAIDPNETIVVSDTTGRYPMQYYDTPRRYFTSLEVYTGRDMDVVPVVVPEYGKGAVVVEEARRRGARLIGIRVWGEEEHDAVAAWLEEDEKNRAILFHTAVYPAGYRLFFEYPEQTSFGDVYPRFEM